MKFWKAKKFLELKKIKKSCQKWYLNDCLVHDKMIFKRSWYSRIWGRWEVASKNLAENGEDKIADLNRRINSLQI